MTAAQRTSQKDAPRGTAAFGHHHISDTELRVDCTRGPLPTRRQSLPPQRDGLPQAAIRASPSGHLQTPRPGPGVRKAHAGEHGALFHISQHQGFMQNERQAAGLRFRKANVTPHLTRNYRKVCTPAPFPGGCAFSSCFFFLLPKLFFPSRGRLLQLRL